MSGNIWLSTERGIPEKWILLGGNSLELTLSADDDDECNDISSWISASHDVEGSSPEHLELLVATALSFNVPYDILSNCFT